MVGLAGCDIGVRDERVHDRNGSHRMPVANWIAGGLALVPVGRVTFEVTTIWSRIVKRLGGVT